MKILITGSTGFVGRHLIPKLIHSKHSILEITIQPEISLGLYGNDTHKYVPHEEDQYGFNKAVKDFKPEIVIHLASFLTSLDDYNTLIKLLNTNITFFCQILDAIKECDIKLFVNTGTFAEYYKGNDEFDPAYLYAATKTASRSFLDYYSKVYHFKQATVVPYTIYGGKDSQKKIIDIIYESTESDKPIDLSPGEQVLDFIHVEDITNFYLQLVEQHNCLPQKSNFKLGTGKGHTLKQVTAIIEEVTQKRARINWGGKPYRPSDVMYAVADINSQIILLKWHPKIELSEGILMLAEKK
jgi:nucleoside-diphosphate-sugar epimerase